MTHGNDRHGHTKGGCYSPEYSTWLSMKARCHIPTSAGYAKYGAKGISVCTRWRESFESFFEDMGPRPSSDHSIDRIDAKGNYEPSNCRWASLLEQANNKSTNRFITCGDRTLTLAQWARESGVDADVIALRIDRNGWDSHKAIFTQERSASSGLKGVYWQQSRKKWNVRFTLRGCLHDLGRFDDLLEAASARLGIRGTVTAKGLDV